MNRSRVLAVLGWSGLASLFVGVALTVSPPFMADVMTHEDAPPGPSVRLTKDPQRIVLPADRTYGIWANDKDNSGYSFGDCSIRDHRGKPIRLKMFEGSAVGTEFGSEYAQFDLEFNTGSGRLTLVHCTGSRAEFSVRPLKHGDPKVPFEPEDGPFGGLMWIAVPLIVGTQLIQFGVGMLVAWLITLFVSKPAPPAA